MSVFKTVKVVMLPTQKAENCLFQREGLHRLSFTNGLLTKQYRIINNITCFHLYLTSDDRIEEGDWVVGGGNNIARVGFNDTKDPEKWIVINQNNAILREVCRKIIATTDRSLGFAIDKSPYPMEIYSLPQPSRSFIDKYVELYNKHNIIEDVLVEYAVNGKCEDPMVCLRGCHVHDGTCKHLLYRKDILKINPKDDTITIKKIDQWQVIREEYLKKRTGPDQSIFEYLCVNFNPPIRK